MIKLDCIVPTHILKQNFRDSRKRGLRYISKLKHSARKKPRTAIICGLGHSLHQFIPHIATTKADVFACKSTEVLKQHGIRVRYEVHVDAQPKEAQFVSKYPDVIYLISSQCDPATFDAIQPYHKYEWHSRMSDTWTPVERKLCLSAGTNVVIHAIQLAVYLGYQNIEVYGMDCSWADVKGASHVNKSTPEQRIQINCEGRTFITTHQMFGMAQEAVRVLANLSSKANITVGGDGLLQFMITTAIEEQLAGRDPFGTHLPDPGELCIAPVRLSADHLSDIHNYAGR